MRTSKTTTRVGSVNIFSATAKLVNSHKITSSLSAATLIIASSVAATAHTSSTHQSAQVSAQSQITQSQPESVSKDVLKLTTDTSTNSHPDEQEPETNDHTTGMTHVNIKTGDDVVANVQVNGQSIATEDNGNTQQSIPNTDDSGSVSVSVDAHNSSGDNSTNKSNNTVRISSSSSTKTNFKSSQTIHSTGGQ